MTHYQLPPTDDRLIWDTWLSLHYLPSVTVADELGIFASLATAPAGAEELSQRLGFDRRTTIATLRMLAALGYLRQHEGRYQLAEPARLYLLQDSPYYWGHMLGRRESQHETLKTRLQGRSPAGRPGAGERAETEGSGTSAQGWARGRIEVEQGKRIAAAMHSHSLPAATGLAQAEVFAGVNCLLDIGAGSGCFAIAAAQQDPDLRATIMELPAMCRAAEAYIRDGGVDGRVDTVEVDMFRQPWPEGYDAHFFANVFHDWNFETCAWLAEQSYAALEPGGAIYLHEMLLDDDGDGPLTAVSFSMLMLGTEGQQFTFPELKGILENAGFRDVQTHPTYGYYSLVTGRKA